MQKPTGDELDQIHRRALGNPEALSAFKAFLKAINERDDLSNRGKDTSSADASADRAREVLDAVLEQSSS